MSDHDSQDTYPRDPRTDIPTALEWCCALAAVAFTSIALLIARCAG